MTSAYSIANGAVVDVLREFKDASFDALMCDPPYGFSFMGKAWDYDVPSVETWRECLRVLKPGAPLVAFGGSRTYHRLACGIEDAGFELRDCLMWLYGKGFPKSQNVRDAIVKAEGPSGFLMPDSEIQKWDGWGTALKPAHEPIVLARKPLAGTMAVNVAKWGVGGLAIDACRIGNDVVQINKYQDNAGRWPANLILDEEAAALLDAEAGDRPSVPYRANTATGAVLPMTARTAGGYADGGGPSRFFYCSKVSTKEREAGCEGLALRSAGEVTDREDICGTCRGVGWLDHPEDKCPTCSGSGRVRTAGLDNPRAGAGRTGGARNHHPTLKPLSLTTWLARLICPPSPGVILVPFAGAGSEMIGALRAGWGGVFGIERESEYVEIARARLRHWCPESEAA